MSASLPDFIIGGAPRSGTTFLCHALEKHPAVFIARPYIPEPKVFMGKEQSIPTYLARYKSFFAAARPGQVLGEKTSYYLESEQACRLIRQATPRVRLVFIVREPVARAYSNYLRSKHNGLETLPFAEAIALEGKRPNPLPADKAYARPFDYLARGRYAEFARRYFDAFGRDRVRFFLYEDIELAPERLFHGLQEFIGAEPLPFAALDPGIVNAAAEPGPPIDAALAQRLRREMQGEVRAFAALTGLDVSAWARA
jgi:hypothetical protein